MKFSRRNRAGAEMDMTPMVDVVFLLLIFFMITAAFGLQKSIAIPDPESDQNSQQAVKEPEKSDDDIFVQVTKDNKILVDGENVATQQELYAKLRERVYENRRQHHLLLLVEPEALHETVVRVIDAATGVGVASIRIGTN